MKTYLTLTMADGRSFDLINMNSQRPALFQVFTIYEKMRVRYHLIAVSDDVLQFAMRDDIPKDILFYEPELSHLIIQTWYADGS